VRHVPRQASQLKSSGSGRYIPLSCAWRGTFQGFARIDPTTSNPIQDIDPARITAKPGRGEACFGGIGAGLRSPEMLTVSRHILGTTLSAVAHFFQRLPRFF